MSDRLYREEQDSMGSIPVPRESLWGAQTQRALLNSPGFNLGIPQPMLRALALIKQAAAEVNGELGIIEASAAKAVSEAAGEVLDGKHDEQFPVGVFQTGSGTSWNMNINEVIAGRANRILGYPSEGRFPVHPNDHVNRGQSSNDVIPTAMNIAARLECRDYVLVLDSLAKALNSRAETFRNIPKLGRTHLQDALPMSLGQEFSAYAAQIKEASRRVRGTFTTLEDLALGGTAVGTGAGAASGFADGVIERISRRTGVSFRGAENRFEAIASRDCMLECMGAVNVTAAALMKIVQDLRLLSSGPRGGLGEIRLPELQPGSSIMPGKINPVVPEIVAQAAVFVTGAYASVSEACRNAPLELNIMQPLIAWEVLSAVRLLSDSAALLEKKCVDGIDADRQKCAEYIEGSLAMATPLAAVLGYDGAAQLARDAYKRGVTVRQAALAAGLDPAEVDRVLDVEGMIKGTEPANE